MSASRAGIVAVLLNGVAVIGGCASDPPPPAAAPEPPKAAEAKAEPDLAQLVMGVDSQEDIVRKLKVRGEPGPCTHPYGGTELTTEDQKRTKDRRRTVCWASAGLRDAPDVIASFYDYGVGSVVYDLWLVFPSSSWSWLPGSMEAALGAANLKIEKTGQRIWHRGDTDVSVGGSECSDDGDRATCKAIALGLTHWPTLKLSTAGVTDRKTSVGTPAP